MIRFDIHGFGRAPHLAVLAAIAAASAAAGPVSAQPEAVTRPAGVSIRGEAPEGFAEEAAAVMRQIEAWRGACFVKDVVVDFVAPEERHGKRAGWYEPASKRLVVVRRGTERFQRGTLLHEIFHALQDQRFELSALQTKAGDGDRGRALSALIEGEAMYAVAELMSYDFRAHAKVPPEGPLDEERFEKIFVYGAGQDFVRALVASGGFAAVDAAFRDPPRSTAAIFHPALHLREKDAAEPEIPEPAPAAGERVAERRRCGEYELRLLLARVPALRAELGDLPPLRGDVRIRFEPEAEAGGGAASGRVAWRLAFGDEAAAVKVRGLLARAGDPVVGVDSEGRIVDAALRP